MPVAASADPGGIAEPDTAEVSEDETTPVVISVLTNDVAGVTITGFSDASFGTVGEVVVSEETTAFTYLPDPDAFGTDSFTYDVVLGEGEDAVVETETVTITITEVDDDPRPQDDVAPAEGETIEENGAAVDLTDLLLSNDEEVDDEELTIVSVDDALTEGTVELTDEGKVIYTATDDVAETDSFTYTVADEGENSATANVTLTITPMDDAPVAVADAESVDEGASVSIDVLANDTDVDAGLKEIDSVGDPDPDIGSAAVDPETGNLVYTAPDELAAEQDVEVSYTLNGGSSAVVTVTVSPVDDAPVAVDDVADVDENGDVLIDVLANDTDVDAGPLEIDTISTPATGTAVEEAGQIRYTHAGDSLDDVSFTYTINGGDEAEVVVSVANDDDDAPVVDDVEIDIDEDADPVSIQILTEGQTDADLSLLSISSVGEATLGTTSVDDNAVIYTPADDVNGDDSFSVFVTDGTSEPVSVTVDVGIVPVNDAPVANFDEFENDMMYYAYYGYGPVVLEDETTFLPLLENDSDVDSESLTVVADSISIDSDIATFEVVDGGIELTPADDWSGYFSFTYVITDGELESESAFVDVWVIPTLDAPVAEFDEAEVDEDDVVYVSVLENDYDVDNPIYGFFDDDFDDFADLRLLAFDDGPGLLIGDGPIGPFEEDAQLEILGVTQPEGGFALVVDDQIRVQPDPDFIGTLYIEYAVRSYYEPRYDDYMGSDIVDCEIGWQPYGPFGPSDPDYCPIVIGYLEVEVLPVNDEPVAENDEDSTLEDEAVLIDVLSNDSDIDGDDLTIWRAGVPSNGTAAIVDGQVEYTPDENFYGEDAFAYYVSDGTNLAVAQIEVTVESVNDVPTIDDESRRTAEDSALKFDLTVFDVEDDDLAITLVEEPESGSVTLVGATMTYTPEDNWYGDAVFSFQVEDTDGGTAVNTVEIEVYSVNDLPTAEDVTESTDEDNSVEFDLVVDDVEDGASLELSIGSAPGHGTVEFDGTTVTYTPDLNWNGDESFTIKVTDTDGGEATADVDIEVAPVNDQPAAPDAMDVEVDEDGTVTFDVAAADVDGDALELRLQVEPPEALGDVTFDGLSATWTPPKDFNGPIVWRVRAFDRGGLSVVTRIDGSVTPVNDAPTIEDESALVDEDGSVDITMEVADIDSEELTISVVDAPAKGSTSVDGLVVTYTPDADVNGADSFEVEVSDGDKTSTATVDVTIAPAQDAPVAQACGPYEVEAGGSVSIAASSCATDIDGDALGVVADSASADSGTVAETGDAVTFTADDAAGTATVTFTVTDGAGGEVEVAADVTITKEDPPPPPPVSPFVGADGLEGQVVRTYSAMLGRMPDMDGFQWWVDQRADGMSFEEMVAKFADSPEFRSIFGNRIVEDTNEEWVEFVYVEIMDRNPEPTGQAFWIEALESGLFTRVDMVIWFAESPEYKAITETN